MDCLLLLNREWKETEQMATTQQITMGHHEVLDSTQIWIRSVLHYYLLFSTFLILCKRSCAYDAITFGCCFIQVLLSPVSGVHYKVIGIQTTDMVFCRSSGKSVTWFYAQSTITVISGRRANGGMLHSAW